VIDQGATPFFAEVLDLINGGKVQRIKEIDSGRSGPPSQAGTASTWQTKRNRSGPCSMSPSKPQS
jgi:hypothetical protein